MKITLLMVLCSASMLLMSGCATSHTESAAWDYKVLTGVVPSDIEKRLNALGQEGWLMVSSTTKPNEPNPAEVLVFLKRRK